MGDGAGFGGRPGGGTSLRLRGTGLFCSEDKEGGRKGAGLGGGDGVSDGTCGGESSVRSMRRGADALAVCVGNPATGVRTSGTTSASGGIFGRDSLRGPPHAEHDSATGVFTNVQRGHAHSKDTSPVIHTSPLASEHRDSPLAT